MVGLYYMLLFCFSKPRCITILTVMYKMWVLILRMIRDILLYIMLVDYFIILFAEHLNVHKIQNELS